MQVFPQFIVRDIVRPRTWQDWSSNVGVWMPMRYCEDICKILCTVPLCKWSEHGSWHTTEKEEYRLHRSFQPLMKLRWSLRTSETNRENEAMPELCTYGWIQSYQIKNLLYHIIYLSPKLKSRPLRIHRHTLNWLQMGLVVCWNSIVYNL